MTNKVYEIITERIIEKIESTGVLPWKQPWKHYLSEGAPQNIVSKKPYRGINTFLLGCSGFDSPFWMSYKQATDLGGFVRKGEKGTPVVWWNWFEKTGKDGKSEKIPCLRYYTVFNLDQCECIEAPKLKTSTLSKKTPIESCEAIVSGYHGPSIQHVESRAYYSPSKDLVNMPLPGSFTTPESYYAVMFHELGHSTGHATRLNRSGIVGASVGFGSDPYAKEELIAEMSSAFLCGYAGISPAIEDQSASYLDSWIKHLRGNSKLILDSVGNAQRSADFILGIKPQFETNEEG